MSNASRYYMHPEETNTHGAESAITVQVASGNSAVALLLLDCNIQSITATLTPQEAAYIAKALIEHAGAVLTQQEEL